MKKYLKIDFTKRDTISVVCLTIVLVLVLVLGNCFGFVHAEGNAFDFGLTSNFTSFANTTDYEASAIYNSDYINNVFYFSSSSASNNGTIALAFKDLCENFPSVDGGGNILDLSNYDTFLLVINTSNSYGLYFYNSDCHVCKFNNTNKTSYIVAPDDSYSYLAISVTYTNGNFVLGSSSENSIVTRINSTTNANYKVLGNYLMLCASNNSFYGPIDGVDYSVSGINSFNLASDVSNFTDINYQLADGSINASGGSSGSGETSLNNLYMNNPFWVYSMPSYSTSNRGNIVKNNGTATFNASMTNYQIEHPSEFNLHFTFEITVKYTADEGWSGGSHGFYLLGSTPYNALGSSTVSRTGVFKYRPASGSQTYSELSLEHFNGSYSFNTLTNYRYIFANCYLDGDTSKDDFLSWYSGVYSSDSVQFSSIVLKCTAELFDTYQNYSSPCIYQYDFVSGVASKLSDGMGTNNNPYDYENQDSYTDSVTGSFGYVTQNNNQTVTITNSNVNSNDISNVIGDIGDDQDSDSLINKFSTLLSLSSWVAVFASAMGFVPVAFWTNLVEYFAVALGILSTFLVLRYILNLLT